MGVEVGEVKDFGMCFGKGLTVLQVESMWGTRERFCKLSDGSANMEKMRGWADSVWEETKNSSADMLHLGGF